MALWITYTLVNQTDNQAFVRGYPIFANQFVHRATSRCCHFNAEQRTSAMVFSCRKNAFEVNSLSLTRHTGALCRIQASHIVQRADLLCILQSCRTNNLARLYPFNYPILAFKTGSFLSNFQWKEPFFNITSTLESSKIAGHAVKKACFTRKLVRKHKFKWIKSSLGN